MAGPTITSTLEILHNGTCRAHILGTFSAAGDDADGTLIDLSAIALKGATVNSSGLATGGQRPLGLKYKTINGTMTGNLTLLLETKGAATDQFIHQQKCNTDEVTYINVDFTNSQNDGLKPYRSEAFLTDTTFDAQASVTVAADTDIRKVGASSARQTIAAGFTTGLVASDDFTAVDLSGYDGFGCFIRSSVALQPGDLSFLIDDTAACASPIETMPLNKALAAGEWTWIELPFTASARTAIVSFGFQTNRDFGAAVIYLDGLRWKKLDGGQNAGSAIGDMVETVTGSASGDHFELEVEFSLVYSQDSFRGILV